MIDRAAEAFLAATVSDEALAWLEATKPVVAAWRSARARDLRALGLEVRESPATFLFARVPRATELTAALRHRSLRVRNTTSFGPPTTCASRPCLRRPGPTS